MEIEAIIKNEIDYAMYGCVLEDMYCTLWNAVRIGFAKKSFAQWGSGFVALEMPAVFRNYFPYYKYKITEEELSWKL